MDRTWKVATELTLNLDVLIEMIELTLNLMCLLFNGRVLEGTRRLRLSEAKRNFCESRSYIMGPERNKILFPLRICVMISMIVEVRAQRVNGCTLMHAVEDAQTQQDSLGQGPW